MDCSVSKSKRSLTVAVILRLGNKCEMGVEALTQKDLDESVETVSQAQLSVILGISTSRIRQLDKENALVKIGRGKYDLPKSIQKYIEFQISKATAETEDELNKLKEDTLWTRARRMKSEMEYKIMAGELHRSEDIKEVMNDMLARFRSQLLAFPTKAAPKVIGVTEIMVVRETLKEEIYELMQELSNYDPDVFYEKSDDKIYVESPGDSNANNS